jgi:hypothetical protein
MMVAYTIKLCLRGPALSEMKGNQMNEGTLLGRIGPVSGIAGFVPYFRLPVTLSYQGQMTESLDVISLSATAYVMFASRGRLTQESFYIGPAAFDPNGARGVVGAWRIRNCVGFLR